MMENERPRESNAASGEMDFDIFISHAPADKEVARRLVTHLEQKGLRVWFDEARLEPGDGWQQAIRDALEQSRICIVLLSRSVLPSKPLISHEWAQIQDCTWRRRDFSVCPVMLDDARMPPFLRDWQSIRLENLPYDPVEFDRAIETIVHLVKESGIGRKTAPSLIEERVTTERFNELQRALAERLSADEQRKER